MKSLYTCRQEYYGKSLPTYTTTEEVENVLRYDAKSISKYVPQEMLCSEKNPFSPIVQKRRFAILQRSTSLSSSANKNDTSGTSVSEVDEFIFEAADFGDLNIHDKKTNEITKYQVMVYANGKYILGETTPCFE